MKLNYDLIRDILLDIEEIADGHTNYPFLFYWEEKFISYDQMAFFYHMKYLSDARLIEAKNGYFIDLTPKGREYLDNIRDKTIWDETKSKIKPLGNVTLDVITATAKALVLKYLGLN
ncbi:MAG: DUF2513 domain-containing protein [Negativicutes bacterium]|nr:DUF2513 domain-containing protein [Negativicutes bacterium]